MPFSFFGLYTTETRLILDVYARFFDRLRAAARYRAAALSHQNHFFFLKIQKHRAHTRALRAMT